MWFSTTPSLCVSSFIWIIHQATNGSTLIFHLETLHHHTLFNMFFDKIFKAHHARILSCFSLGVDVWLIVQPIFLTFQLSSPFFFTTLWMRLGLLHPLITNIPQCVCTHPIDVMGIRFLRCVHGNEHTSTHDAICDTFATIPQDVGFHMGRKQLHALISTTFNSSVDKLTLCSPKMTFAP